jgi:Putative amidase domain
VLYDWNNDGVFDHEAILTASDGTNPDGSTNWDLVDAHTSNRYHAYWTLAQYNASWATTRIVVLHIPATTS